jgi:hypothetical protein
VYRSIWQCVYVCETLTTCTTAHLNCYYCDNHYYVYSTTRRSTGLGNACKREFFEHHRTALVYSGFTAQQLCMITLDASLKLALWHCTTNNSNTSSSSVSDSATAYAWYAPTAQAALDLTYHSYVPIPVSADLLL